VADEGAAPLPGARERLLVAALLVVVVFAYQPAWNGGFLWDDAAHLTRADLRSWRGLWRIWFEPGATQQYYPLVHTAFWVQHHLWGEEPTGYHLVNLGLHLAAAAMVAVACDGYPSQEPCWPPRSSRSIRCTSSRSPGSAS
jgi:hypothetical protein